MVNKHDEFVVIDEFGKEIMCYVISIIEIGNKKYLIYKNELGFYASEIGTLKETLELIPITNEDIWKKIEEEFKSINNEIIKRNA